jgi:DNA polymerase-3 subunit epsilon
VLVEGDRVERWTTPVKGGTSRRFELDEWRDAPRFADIAPDLARRLDGRLLVAHNARFDHAFLTAEFARAAIVFEPQVVCSVMLSRRLYPALDHHDLDSLCALHGLQSQARHRALPDADLVWQWWQAMHRDRSVEEIDAAIRELLAGPVLPSHLDPSLIERLPSSPGAYVFHGEAGQPLLTGAAANLKLHVVNYFKLDRASARALEYSHRITHITWRATRGMLGARLHAAVMARVHRPGAGAMSWSFAPDTVPCITTVARSAAESFGLFASERKSHNALLRLANRHRLCHALVGVDDAKTPCRGCADDVRGAGCGSTTTRKKHLMRLFAVIRPMRIEAWPHRGAIGIRERSDMHIVDEWEFLGTARNEGEVHELLAARREGFDRSVYKLLARELRALAPDRIVDLSGDTRVAATPRDAAAASPPP